MVLGFVIGNYFGTQEGSLVWFALGTLVDLVIGTWEGSLVGFSLGFSYGYPFESPNTGAVLFFGISEWNGTWDVSWKLYWIPDWLYLEYQLVWNLVWRFKVPLTLQMGRLFIIQLTWDLTHSLACQWDLSLEINWTGLLIYLYDSLCNLICFISRNLFWLWMLI